MIVVGRSVGRSGRSGISTSFRTQQVNSLLSKSLVDHAARATWGAIHQKYSVRIRRILKGMNRFVGACALKYGILTTKSIRNFPELAKVTKKTFFKKEYFF
jgi:hypothetical protein